MTQRQRNDGKQNDVITAGTIRVAFAAFFLSTLAFTAQLAIICPKRYMEDYHENE